MSAPEWAGTPRGLGKQVKVSSNGLSKLQLAVACKSRLEGKHKAPGLQESERLMLAMHVTQSHACILNTFALNNVVYKQFIMALPAQLPGRTQHSIDIVLCG